MITTPTGRVKYDLLNADDFEAYAAKYGRAAARAQLFALAYSAPTMGLKRKLAEYASVDYREVEARALAALYPEQGTVNQSPYYSLRMSSFTLTAVYKAHVATQDAYDGDLPKHRWQALSYSTDCGIVFG